jgi:AraC-like DNA-binding protein
VYFYSDINSSDIAYLFEKYTSIEEIFSLFVSLTIFAYSFQILSKKENLFTKILSFDNLKWIYTFFKLGLFTYIFWIIALAISVALDFKEFIYSYYPLRILTTILIYWIGYQSIIQLRLLKERKDLRNQLTISSTKIDKTTDEEPIDAQKKDIFNKIETLIIAQKLFTEPKLTVDFLATALDVNALKLTSIIKQFSDKNFNDFINEFRITFAKELLVDEAYKNYTITSIGLESGFNSKSSFYATFKKHTNLTPTEYQKLMIKYLKI